MRALVNRSPMIRRFWKEESGLTVLTVWLVLMLFVVYPVTAGHGVMWGEISVSILLISGAAVVGGRESYVVAAIVGLALTFAIHLAATLFPTTTLRVADKGLIIATLLGLASVVLMRVFTPGETTIHRVVGAICAYLLLGLVWATAYELVQVLDPSALRFPELTDHRYSTVYFSFVTLTTVGYGDVVPVHRAAKTLATMEALTGQLYLAILIARLVAREVSDSQLRDRDSA